jgi:hypothetical protein
VAGKVGVAGKLVADVRLFRSISFPHLEWAYGGEWGKLEPSVIFGAKSSWNTIFNGVHNANAET